MKSTYKVTIGGKSVLATDVIDYIKEYNKKDDCPTGLCAYLATRLNTDTVTWVHRYSKSWKDYSGVPQYPVKHPSIADPKVAYQRSDNMLRGEYGRRRKALARHIIKQLEAAIQAANAKKAVANDKVTPQNARMKVGTNSYIFLAPLKACLERMLTDKVEKTYGICGNLSDWYNHATRPLSDQRKDALLLIAKWMEAHPMFSGSKTYPIPATHAKKSAQGQYCGTMNYWNQKTEYGRLRIQMVHYLISKVDEEIDKLVNPR